MARTDIIPLYGDEEKLGPKMKALTPLQRNFVICLSKRATRNNADALRQAGWAGKEENLRQHAYSLAHDERIQEALIEHNRRQLKSLVPAAVEELATLLDSNQVDGSTKLKAVAMVLDRAGLHAVSEHKSTVEHIGQDQNLLQASQALAASLGIDLSDLIGARLAKRQKAIPVPTIEAEYIEVPPVTMEDLI